MVQNLQSVLEPMVSFAFTYLMVADLDSLQQLYSHVDCRVSKHSSAQMVPIGYNYVLCHAMSLIFWRC